MVTTGLHVLNELNLFLDEQTQQVTETLDRIDMLRAAVIRRDKGLRQIAPAEIYRAFSTSKFCLISFGSPHGKHAGYGPIPSCYDYLLTCLT